MTERSDWEPTWLASKLASSEHSLSTILAVLYPNFVAFCEDFPARGTPGRSGFGLPATLEEAKGCLELVSAAARSAARR